jgi:hypothetical protein
MSKATEVSEAVEELKAVEECSAFAGMRLRTFYHLVLTTANGM